MSPEPTQRERDAAWSFMSRFGLGHECFELLIDEFRKWGFPTKDLGQIVKEGERSR